MSRKISLKYLVIGLFVIFAFIVTVINLNLDRIRNSQKTSLLTTVTLSPPPTPFPNWLYYTDTTTDRDYEVSVRATHTSGRDYLATVSAYATTNQNIVLNSQNQILDSIWSGLVKLDYLSGFTSPDPKPGINFNDKSTNVTAWSPNNDYLAFWTKNKIILANFKPVTHVTPPILYGQPSTKVYEKGLIMNQILEIPTPFSSSSYYDVSLFFDGLGNNLYLKVYFNDFGLWRYNISDKTLKQVNLPAGVITQNTYPLPRTTKLISWIQQTSYKYNLIIWDDRNSQTIKIDRSFDYPGKIIFSPDLQAVCYEAGSSGSWWATVINLVSNKTIYQGDQYSYCRRFLNNHEVIVTEKGYFSSFTDWLKIDVSSGKTEILDSL